MPSTVSVIIPTFRRPHLLREAIESVWAQTLPPDEILIGDDSDNDDTERLIASELEPASPIPVRYFHHRPALREGANVEFLYREASGDLVLYLHDDDPVYPGCLAQLKPALESHAEAVGAFGLQWLLNDDGSPVRNGDGINEDFFRTPDRAGLVDGLMAGATAMFPNNGFLVRRDAAVAVGYHGGGRAGRATDFYFGFRLGQLGRPFVFVPQLVSKVRMTTGSTSREAGADNAYHHLRLLLDECPPERVTGEVAATVRRVMPQAIAIAAARGERAQAWAWLWSPHYRPAMASPRWWKSFAQCVSAR